LSSFQEISYFGKVKYLMSLLFICSLAFAELPSVLEYRSGATITNYTVVEWKETSVIVKRGQGGPFPVTFSTLIPEQREIFEAEATRYLTSKATAQENRVEAQRSRDEAKRQAVAEEKEREKAFRAAIRQNEIKIGMTPSQVIESWGRASSINSSSDGFNQWVYYWQSSTSYLYFRNGRLSSWQRDR
jgi:hypothetical protein